MKPDFHDVTGTCRTVSDMLSRIGDKWSMLVISYLGEKPMRFNELRRDIGNISQKMLTSTLRNLERDGLVLRTVTPTSPPRVDYELTPLGRDLLVPVQGLAEWTIKNIERILTSREDFDKSKAA